jgi:hypothetical protein
MVTKVCRACVGSPEILGYDLVCMPVNPLYPAQRCRSLMLKLSGARLFARPRQCDDTYGGPLLGIPRWSAEPGKNSRRYGGDLRRFYPQQHQCYCGLDLHARTMYLGVFN